MQLTYFIFDLLLLFMENPKTAFKGLTGFEQKLKLVNDPFNL